MAAFDAATLWDELQKEEQSLRCKINTLSKSKNNKQFWRKPITAKHEKKDRWNELKQGNKSTKTVISKCKINSIKHAMNLLNDAESSKCKRLDCLHFINDYLTNYDGAKQTKQPQLDTMDILKNVIKIFVDPKEPLRHLSIDIITNHIGNNNKIWDYQTSIKYIIPIIVHCILSEEYQEKSEEIRLKLLCLLECIINIAENENEIKPICGDLVAILMRLLHDSYSEINKKTCAVLIKLSEKIRLNAVSKLIIENAVELLSHRHSSVRVAGIELIECMLMKGGHESIQKLTGFREHNVVPLEWWFGGELRANYFGALCRHKKYAVRKAFYKMVFNVMTNMVERYDYS